VLAPRAERNRHGSAASTGVIAPGFSRSAGGRVTPPAQTWRFGTSARVVIGIGAAFMFLIALFLFSLPFWIGGSADATSTAMIDVTGALMAGFGTFFLFGLSAMARTRVTLDGSLLAATVPAGHNWLLVPAFREVRLPVSQIRSVERRQEIYKWAGFGSLRETLSVVTQSGERIGLFTNTVGPASQLPIDDIAAALARAAGVEVVDGGTVISKAPGLYGQPSSTWTETPLDAATAQRKRAGVARTSQIVFFLVMMTLVLRACLNH
jgi:hypothetical protein